MASDTKVRLATLILRGVLGAIFIWHGLDKVVSSSNDLGANWANQLWESQARTPEAVKGKLAKLPPRAWLTDAERDSNVPDEKAQEIATLRVKETQAQLDRAFSADAPPTPEFFSHVVQYVVAWGELVGGVALVIGLLTRIAATGLIIIQAGAIYFVTGVKGLSETGEIGYEYNVALIAMCLALVVMGGGGWSIDRFLRWGPKKAAQQSPTSPPAPAEPAAAS